MKSIVNSYSLLSSCDEKWTKIKQKFLRSGARISIDLGHKSSMHEFRHWLILINCGDLVEHTQVFGTVGDMMQFYFRFSSCESNRVALRKELRNWQLIFPTAWTLRKLSVSRIILLLFDIVVNCRCWHFWTYRTTKYQKFLRKTSSSRPCFKRSTLAVIGSRKSRRSHLRSFWCSKIWTFPTTNLNRWRLRCSEEIFLLQINWESWTWATIWSQRWK